MFEDGLNGLVVATQQYHVLIERLDFPYQFDAVHQENGTVHVFLAQGVEELVLKVLTLAHFGSSGDKFGHDDST